MSALTVTWMPRPTDEQFDRAAPLLDLVVRKATKGEFTVEDLRRMAQEGRVLIGIAERNGQTVMAAALELVRYPQFATLNIMAIGGSGLSEVAEKFFDELKAFARDCGAKHIEADCSRAMGRLLRAFHGFTPTYEKVRFAL